MFEAYIDITAITVVIMVIIAIPILIPLLLIQHFVHKKILDPTYFNINHFSAGELVILTTGFIFYIHKTLIYVRAIVLPKTMRVRFKENILTYKDHPIVYFLACFTMLLIALGIIILINFIIFAGFWNYYE